VVGPVDGLVISANAKNVKGAEEFLAYMMANEKIQADWTGGYGALSANVKVDPKNYNEVMQRAFETVAKSDTFAFNYDLATPPPVAEVGLSMFSRFMDDPSKYEEILIMAAKDAEKAFKEK